MTTFSFKAGDTIGNWADDDSDFLEESNNIDSKYLEKMRYIDSYVTRFANILKPLHAMKIGMVLLQMIKQTPIEYRGSHEEIEATLCQYVINKIIVEDQIPEADTIQCVKGLCTYFSNRLRSESLKSSLMNATRMTKIIDPLRLRQHVWDSLDQFDNGRELKESYEVIKIEFITQYATRPTEPVIQVRKPKVKSKPSPDADGWTTVSK